MKNLILSCAMLGAGIFGTQTAQAACADAAGPCEIAEGSYHLVLPENHNGQPLPVVMFLHGYGSQGGATIRNKKLRDPILARGYALIAPNGIPRTEGRPNSWSFLPRETPARDELAFFKAILNDAQRYGVDHGQVLLAGFSAGAFMVSYAACAEPDAFAAYAPLAGGFWRPHPTECNGPVRLFQTHGWNDGTVPIEGRPLAGGLYLQGDIFQTMQIWRHANSCDQMRADERRSTGDFWRRKWTKCASNSALEFALYPGGHTLPDGWTDMVLSWFESLPAPAPGN